MSSLGIVLPTWSETVLCLLPFGNCLARSNLMECKGIREGFSFLFCRVDPELLHQYQQHVSTLARQLGKPELPSSTDSASLMPMLQNGHSR